EQARSEAPVFDPAQSRRGFNEMEIAVDVMDALFNDKGEVWPVNVPNHGAITGLPDDMVVEVPGYIDRQGIRPIVSGTLPRHLMGLVAMLGEYQAATAQAAWE